jgi:flagellar hook-basal body complex protein FliE
MSLSSVSMDTLLSKLEAARTAASGLPAAKAAKVSKAAGQVDFESVLKSSIDRVDTSLKSSTAIATRFQLGDPTVSLEDSMIAMQKANITFQAAVQVRNKVVAAYQDIMNLPI